MHPTADYFFIQPTQIDEQSSKFLSPHQKLIRNDINNNYCAQLIMFATWWEESLAAICCAFNFN